MNYGRKILLDIDPAQSDLPILGVKTNMPLEYPEQARAEQKMCEKKKELFTTEMPVHCWPFRRPVVGGDKFSPLAPVLLL